MDIAGESARPPPVVGQQSLRRGPRLAYAQRPVLDTTLRTVARRPIAVDVPVRKIHLKTLTAAATDHLALAYKLPATRTLLRVGRSKPSGRFFVREFDTELPATVNAPIDDVFHRMPLLCSQVKVLQRLLQWIHKNLNKRLSHGTLDAAQLGHDAS
jgi:hypothetical protein